MYYPYFRGKQFELILLRDNVKLIAAKNFHPIIEPVKDDFTAMLRTAKILAENHVEFTLIVNPQVPSIPIKTDKILSEFFDSTPDESKNIHLGYILNAESNLNVLSTILERFSTKNITLIHYGYTNAKELTSIISNYDNISNHVFIDGFAGKLYQRQFKKDSVKRILIRNGFKSQKKNAHYPPSEHFSDLHITYPDEGMDGFGDYLIVGDDYTETGGPAYAVAIHLTYLDDDDMYIYHFLSDQTDSPTDPGGKFLEALRKLIREYNKPKTKILNSSAVQEFVSLNKQQHYPGLGFVKKLSMQHHLELIANAIEASQK